MQNCGALTRSWYFHITDVASRSMEEPNATKFQRVEKTVRKTTTSRAATRTENYSVMPKYLLFHFQRSSYGTSASAKNSLCLEARYIFKAKKKMSLSLKYSLCLGERGLLQKMCFCCSIKFAWTVVLQNRTSTNHYTRHETAHDNTVLHSAPQINNRLHWQTMNTDSTR